MGNRALISHRCLKQSFNPQGEQLRASWTKDVVAGSSLRPQENGQVDDALELQTAARKGTQHLSGGGRAYEQQASLQDEEINYYANLLSNPTEVRIDDRMGRRSTQMRGGAKRKMESIERILLLTTNTYYSIYQEIKVLSGSISDVGGFNSRLISSKTRQGSKPG